MDLLSGIEDKELGRLPREPLETGPSMLRDIFRTLKTLERKYHDIEEASPIGDLALPYARYCFLKLEGLRNRVEIDRAEKIQTEANRIAKRRWEAARRVSINSDVEVLSPGAFQPKHQRLNDTDTRSLDPMDSLGEKARHPHQQSGRPRRKVSTLPSSRRP